MHKDFLPYGINDMCMRIYYMIQLHENPTLRKIIEKTVFSGRE